MAANHFSRLFSLTRTATYMRPNIWDIFGFLLLFGFLLMIVHGGRQTLESLATIHNQPISLDPLMLPGYVLRSVLRMLVAIICSTIFTFCYATLAAKSRRAEMILIPLLDILQSVPVLGFLSFTVIGFMALFPGQIIGVECAAVFAIFTAQAWNMAFSFYQSLKTVPRDLEEVSNSFHLGAWQRFWRLDVPFAMPGLVWNAMMSMSGGWFFVVASEAITVGHTTITLPGVGSYLAKAIAERQLSAVGYTILAMLITIMIYDQCLFRPLVAWAEKFRFEQSASDKYSKSWLLSLLRRTKTLRLIVQPIFLLMTAISSIRLPEHRSFIKSSYKISNILLDRIWYFLIAVAGILILYNLISYIAVNLGWHDVTTVLYLGLYTFIRVFILTILASLLWIPIGVYIGLSPRLSGAMQPIIQFLAAFPANIAFPFFVIIIIKFQASPNIWLSPLMILGTQWYILFNVIAGASALPNDLREVASSFRVRGLSWWFKVILPGIFPYYITGAMTASGGAWNASIVAETVNWGNQTLTAKGLGSYLAIATTAGDYPRIVLGIAIMSIYVVLFNRCFWRRLFVYATSRLRS